MINKTKTLSSILVAPILYAAISYVFWRYALYQNLSDREFITYLLTAGGLLAVSWLTLNRRISLIYKIGFVVIVFVVSLLMLMAYVYNASLPGGWEQLR